MPATPLAFTDSDIESLERATLDAVAPPAVETYDGWLLPLDASTIGRAKSAVPLRHHSLRSSSVEDICTRYARHGLPSAFRVADVPELAALHADLRDRGFQPDQPTLFQVGSVTGILNLACDAPAPVFETPVAQWAAVYVAPGFDPADGAHRVQALSRSSCIVFSVVCADELPVAAGTASLSQGWVGIHGMRTVVQQRGKGLATRVLAGLARHARAHQLERVFLQVEESNSTALALYHRAGFLTAWRYHYWRRP
jgi:GNAT superfamily N-acetyltransferase